MIILGVSSFELRNNTQVYLEKSSTITKAYRFLDRDITFTGPNKSICKSCSGSVILVKSLLLCDAFFDFPFSHASQRPSLQNSMSGKPRANSLLTKEVIVLKFKCDNLLCQSQLSSVEALL